MAVDVFDQIGNILSALEEANLEALKPILASNLVPGYFSQDDLLKSQKVTAIQAVTGGTVEHIYHAQLTSTQAAALQGITDPNNLVSSLIQLLNAASEAIIAALENNCWVGNLFRYLRKPSTAPLDEEGIEGSVRAFSPGHDPSLIPCDVPNATPPCSLLTPNQCTLVGGAPAGPPGAACPKR
jgi:hypothetical protein